MDSHRAAELRAKRERLEQLRRAKAEAEAAHEARFGRLAQGGEAMAPGQIPAELEALFNEALRQRITTEGSIDTMRRHIAAGAPRCRPLPRSPTCLQLHALVLSRWCGVHLYRSFLTSTLHQDVARQAWSDGRRTIVASTSRPWILC